MAKSKVISVHDKKVSEREYRKVDNSRLHKTTKSNKNTYAIARTQGE